jgi:tyrosine-protein phosphatase SIW14
MTERFSRFASAILGFGSSGLLVAGCAPQTPVTSATTQPAYPVIVIPDPKPQRPMSSGYVPGVGNFGFISADVWRGARPTPLGFQVLKGMGVRTILDLQESDLSSIIPAGVNYVPLRTSQWHANDVDVAAVLKVIQDSPKPVYIHCLEGRDRTGLAVGAYRLSRGMKMQDVIAELKSFGVHFWWRGPIERRLRQLAAGPVAER